MRMYLAFHELTAPDTYAALGLVSCLILQRHCFVQIHGLLLFKKK